MATREEQRLLEREFELARSHALLSDAAEGRGRLIVVEGPAGIGKTVLLEEVCRRAAATRFAILRARAGPLERNFPYGVVRQLFEADLHGRPDHDRAELLSGAAALAAPVVAPGATSATDPDTADASFAVTHGLYWLAANLAERRPLVIGVDDAHWTDAASLRYLLHLAARLEGMPLLLVVCIRSGEPDANRALLSHLRLTPGAETLRPEPLSRGGTAAFIAARLGEEAADEFAAACHELTGGTPFLLAELLTAVSARDMQPRTAALSELGSLGPSSVAQAILVRLGWLPRAAAEVARAVAVLGPDAQLHRAALLAGVDEAEAAEAADALAQMNILHPGSPLQFVHPVVREAIYEDVPAVRRASIHLRAAELLAGEHADSDRIAAHLLLAEPAARAWVVARLRDAASHALATGAAENAATYLRRALEEGGSDRTERAELLFELGRAERRNRAPVAADCLNSARELATDPVQRGRIVYELADSLFYMENREEPFRLVGEAIPGLEIEDRELAIRLEALRAAHELWHREFAPSLARRLPRLAELAVGESQAERMMALLLANIFAWLRHPQEMIRHLLDTGLANGRLPAEEGPDSWVLAHALQALTITEQLDRALAVGDAAMEIARRRGSIAGVGLASAHRTWPHVRCGDLAMAELDARTALNTSREQQLGIAATGVIWYLTDALIERAELEDEASRVLATEPAPHLEPLGFWTLAHETRGRLRLARGDMTGAVEDLTVCRESPFSYGSINGQSWRTALAVAIAQSDRAEARALAGEHVELAREAGFDRGLGVGLRALGVVEGGRSGLRHLEDAIMVLERSPARLEHARALVELGAARRRAGRRTDARDPLRAGMDLAHLCGATRLEERARQELAATGARPRRVLLSGRDALTATELRIAEMAAEGMSNPEIAQAMFVTRKTVENHLGRIYSKLGINSREQLPEALATDSA